MAKWGDNWCWGGGTKWGAGESPVPCPTRTGRYLWVLEIAWDGSFTGANEAAGRLTDARGNRGKKSYTNKSGSGLEAVYAASVSLTLENYDGRYDPYNPASVVYGNRPQGRQVRLSIKDVPTGVRYPVFAGYIQDMQPASWPEKKVVITCSDDIEALSKVRVTIPLTFNTTASAAIDAILDQAGFTDRDIQTSAHPLTLFSLNKATAMQEISSLAEASLGQFFVTRDGRLRYYDLSYSGMPSHAIDEDNIWKEIKIQQPWDSWVSHVEVSANRWVRTQVKKIWETASSISLPAGGSTTIQAEWSGICTPIALDPAAGDYSQQRVGSITGAWWWNCYLTNITSSGCTVNIYNGGPYGSTTGIRIRGREYVQSYPAPPQKYLPWQPRTTPMRQSTSTKVTCSAGDDTVPARNRAYLALDNEYIQDKNYAQAYADLLKAHLANGSKNPVITFENAVDPDLQFGIELFDKVVLTSPTLGIDGETYYLGHVEWWWGGPTGQSVFTRYTLINHLVSGTPITSEGIETVNDEQDDGTSGGSGGVPPLPPETGGQCLYDAPANGPFDLGGVGVYSNIDSGRFVTGGIACTARGTLTHINPTVVQISAIAEATTDGQTYTPTTMPELTARLYNGGVNISSSTMTGGRAEFYLANTYPINSVTVEIEAAAGTTYAALDISEYAAASIKYDSAHVSPPSDPGGYITVSSSQTGAAVTFLTRASPLQLTGGAYITPNDTITAISGMSVTAQFRALTLTKDGPGDQSANAFVVIHYDDASTDVNNTGLAADGVYHEVTTVCTKSSPRTIVGVEVVTNANSQTFGTFDIKDIRLNIGPEIGAKRITVSSFTISNVCPA